jgi:uncharacterized RDD family membrane protein YckC
VAGSLGHAAATTRAQATARRVHGVTDEPSPAEYAGLVTRAIAFALDAALINIAAVLVGILVGLVFSILPAPGGRHDLAVVVGAAAFALWVLGYFAAFWTTTGQTPGNRAMRITVVRVDGEPLRPRHAVVRLIGIVLSAVVIVGFVPILVNERRRGLHDWMAGTVVTTAPPTPAGSSP